jgi:hypothetical protein
MLKFSMRCHVHFDAASSATIPPDNILLLLLLPVGGLPDGHHQTVVEYEQLATPVLGLPLQRLQCCGSGSLVRGVDPDPSIKQK